MNLVSNPEIFSHDDELTVEVKSLHGEISRHHSQTF